ncbi:STK19 kinase, partial [Buphagus erythrorhynchus]|nr:STK19 kinase [Buphagus erythrorhynchus]
VRTPGPGGPPRPRVTPGDPVVTPLSPGRRALLALVRRSRHREVPLRDLQGGKTPPGAGLGVPFLLHDLLGAEQLQSVPTAAGPLLRLAES